MDLLLLDDLDEVSQNLILSIKRKNKVEFTRVWQEIDFDNYENIYLFVNIQNCFVSYTIQEFLLSCKAKINIVTLSKDINMADAFVSWANSISFYNRKRFNICMRLTYSNLAENIGVLDGIINKIFENQKNSVVIYTDGACSGNPGPGGWGVVLLSGKNKKEASGFEQSTTNNRMELTAVINALSMLKKRCKVELYSDSAYVVNAINQNWLDNWRNNRWKNSDKEKIKNIELWQELDKLIAYHKVNFYKVKGHSDNEYNNRCDELATDQIKKYLEKIKKEEK